MTAIKWKVVALAVGSAALMLILPVSLRGTSLAPAAVLVSGPVVSVSYRLQRRLFPTAELLFNRTLEQTMFGGLAGLFAALAANKALQGEWGSTFSAGAICLFILCVWGLRVWRMRTGRISYDYAK